MSWQEDIYRFRIVKVINLSLAPSLRKHYQLKSYNKDGKELCYPLGKFISKTSVQEHVLELIKQMPHPCTLDDKVEVLEIKEDRSKIEQGPLSHPRYKIQRENLTSGSYYRYTHADGKRMPIESHE